MPTPNIQIILQSVIAVMNNLVSPQTQIITLDLGNPTLGNNVIGGTAVFYDPYFQALAGGSAVSLPAAKVFAIVVQNTSLTANLQVTHTPFGAASSTALYGPGGVCILFDPSEAGGGFSALTLTGVGGTVSAIVLVGV
jgi:hypothetical protein